MAYPASTGLLSKKLQEVDDLMLTIQRYCLDFYNHSITNSMTSTQIFNLHRRLINDRNQLNSYSSVNGLAAYAQEQKNLPGLNIVTEFTNVVNAINNTTNWIENNFPKDANGYVLSHTLNQSGLVDRVFTPVMLETLRTQINQILQSIN